MGVSVKNLQIYSIGVTISGYDYRNMLLRFEPCRKTNQLQQLEKMKWQF
jgi:hypothetical protein